MALVVALVALVASLLLLVPGRQQTASTPSGSAPGEGPTVTPAPSATAPPVPRGPVGPPGPPSPGGPVPPTASPTAPPTAPTAPTARPTDQPCASAVPAESRRVRALSFNIHGGLGGGGLRLGTVAEEIEATGADVVFLQEVDRFRGRSRGTDQPSILADRLGMHVAFGSNVRHPPTGRGRPAGQYGTAVLSRWPITDQRNIALPNERGLEQRGLLFAALDLDGTRIHVYGTHLQHTRGSIRLRQMRAVTQVVAADPVPHLLAGDFNAEPGSPALNTVGRYLLDPWPVVGEGAGLTVPPRAPRRRIDFVLHDHWFTPVAARTVRSAVSDHRAVLVDLDLQTLPGCLPG